MQFQLELNTLCIFSLRLLIVSRILNVDEFYKVLNGLLLKKTEWRIMVDHSINKGKRVFEL